jgi:omega-6 fatty acid desaturase (delta-12 desaturase)
MNLEINTVMKILRRYELRDDQKSYALFYSYLGAFLITLATGAYCHTISPWLSAVTWLPMWILMCRFFVFLHDCGHYSLFKSRRMNHVAGTVFGFFILVPDTMWKKIHNSHHAATGNLDRRKDNPGEFLMTVEEYRTSNSLVKLRYRFIQSVYVRMLLIPLSFFLIGRIPFPKMGMKVSLKTMAYNGIYAVLVYLIIVNGGFMVFASIFLIPLYAMYVFASLLFFIQHQYEDVSWAHQEEWDRHTAALFGASYLKFGPIMNWITGNIGCHHIHHLNSKIPCYHLQEATDAVHEYVNVKSIRFWDLFSHLSYVLWDEKKKKIVPFKAVRT